MIMSGCIWKYSQHLDDQDLLFARREFVTYRMAHEYYGLGEKPTIRMAWASGAVFKIGKNSSNGQTAGSDGFMNIPDDISEDVPFN